MNLVSCPLDGSPVADERVNGCPRSQSARDFYHGYAWCLNVYPTVREAVGHLRDELTKPDHALTPWQRQEVLTNIYLLSCGIISTLEDYFQGTKYRLPWRLASPRWAGSC